MLSHPEKPGTRSTVPDTSVELHEQNSYGGVRFIEQGTNTHLKHGMSSVGCKWDAVAGAPLFELVVTAFEPQVPPFDLCPLIKSLSNAN
ncbi:hypothetical protein VNO77_22490 [Canavalia gladiata]|uniref:Uncharacterized protein n=1 Tax=Canavalia gladiata TaxID=3824 RepID=A0AAN9Q821_CANGL